MVIAGDNSGTCESRPEGAGAVEAGIFEAAACVKFVKGGISMGDKMLGSEAGAKNAPPGPGSVSFSAVESPSDERIEWSG